MRQDLSSEVHPHWSASVRIATRSVLKASFARPAFGSALHCVMGPKLDRSSRERSAGLRFSIAIAPANFRSSISRLKRVSVIVPFGSAFSDTLARSCSSRRSSKKSLVRWPFIRDQRQHYLIPPAKTVWKCGLCFSRATTVTSISLNPAFSSSSCNSSSLNPSQ
jgi:hypothetical protein